jgi:septal ring factor EnvC (AmiA/AmiB activator)
MLPVLESEAQTSAAKKAPSPPRATASPASTEAAQRQQALKSRQQELLSQLAALKRQLAASEATHVEAADALAASEQAISNATRRLRDLARTRAQVESQISALQARERNAAGRQTAQEARLAELLRELHLLSLRDPLPLLLEGDDPGRLGRDAEYLAQISRAAESSIVQLQERRAELGQLERESREKRDELARIEAEELADRTALQREQAQRKRKMGELAKQIASQRNSIGKLERDEKRLTELLDQLAKIIADQARRDAERARLAAAAKQREKTTTPKKPGAELKPEAVVETPSTAGNFQQFKGRMVLPVSGQIAARFGSPRRGDGGAGPSWKGIFIRAPAGADVRSVGPGRVVFADWLRGFGNLMVIDHGEGYLSVYGNNESLLRTAGESVEAGELIAAVGNTGGNEHSGLYFELRFQGRPFDPLGWVAAR